MDKADKQTSIALATALLNHDTWSFSQIVHKMDRDELRQVLNSLASLFVAALDQEQRTQIIEKIQGLGLHVAEQDDA